MSLFFILLSFLFFAAQVAYVTWVDLLAKHVIPLQALALVYEALAETTATGLFTQGLL